MCCLKQTWCCILCTEYLVFQNYHPYVQGQVAEWLACQTVEWRVCGSNQLAGANFFLCLLPLKEFWNGEEMGNSISPPQRKAMQVPTVWVKHHNYTTLTNLHGFSLLWTFASFMSNLLQKVSWENFFFSNFPFHPHFKIFSKAVNAKKMLAPAGWFEPLTLHSTVWHANHSATRPWT